MGNKKILVADDEPDFLAMIKIRLEANGYDVVTASDGEEVLTKFDAESPDAVILDILMPKLNGLDALKAIKNKNKNIPVYIITAFPTDERFKTAKDLDVSGFIAKTGDLQKEIQNITNMLRISDSFRGKNQP